MNKTKITIEYQLKKASINILWNSISSSLGLSEWFADKVENKENNFTFTWGKNKQNANILSLKQHSYIRYQWEEDTDTEYYFEFKILTLPITGELALVISDFADPSESEDLKLLWNKQIDVLRRKTGV